MAFIFGGIALATAPAPALSIVNEYHTKGPVTKTLIPLAAIDDIIGVIVFFTIISIISGIGGASVSPIAIVGTILFPFIIGFITGICAVVLIKWAEIIYPVLWQRKCIIILDFREKTLWI